MRRRRGAAKPLKGVQRIHPADAGPPPKLGLPNISILRGGTHAAKIRAGTKSEKRRRAILEGQA